MNEEIIKKVETLRQQYADLQKVAAMADVAEKLTETATKIVALPNQVQEIRTVGYAYANYLEGKVEALNSQWDEIHARIVESLEEELSRAQSEMDVLDDLWVELDTALIADDSDASTEAKEKIKAAIVHRQSQPKTAHKFGAAVALAQVPRIEKAGQPEKKKGSGLLASMATATESAGEAEKPKGGMMGTLSAAAKKNEEPDEPEKPKGGMMGALSAAAKKNEEPDEPEKPKGGMASAAASRLGSSEKSLVGGDPQTQVAADVERLVGQLEGAMGRLQGTIDNAKTRIDGLYGPVPSNVEQTISQLNEIKRYIELSKNASFDWLAGEDMFMVVEAEWKKTGKDKEDPDGYFYVTNQRIVMEQSEKVGGGLFRKGESAHGIVWEAPIGSLNEVESEKKGMLGGIDLIHLRFGAGAPFGETTIEVKGGINAKWFANKLRLMMNGEVEKERGQTPHQAEVEMLQDAPTTCPTCGATFDQPVTRGMSQLTCVYCGTIVRLG